MNQVREYLLRNGAIGRGMFRSRRLLAMARGMPCMHCTAQDGTVVMAHANWPEYGKGAGEKAHDCFVAALCRRCHQWIDQRLGGDPTGVWTSVPEDRKEAWRLAHANTLLYLMMTGKVKVP